MPRPKKGNKLIGPYAKPKVRCSGSAYQPGSLELAANHFIRLDSAQWFTWLEQELAFRAEQVYYLANRPLSQPYFLSYTVRPERRQRGQGDLHHLRPTQTTTSLLDQRCHPDPTGNDLPPWHPLANRSGD